jgi:hypothetical protein
MRRFASRLAIIVTLVGVGWAAGRAQTPPPEFELVVDAPAGETTVTCKRGCELVWAERMSPNAARQPTFTFKCGGASAKRCSSATIGGWVK